jgi:hypothetical protein
VKCREKCILGVITRNQESSSFLCCKISQPFPFASWHDTESTTYTFVMICGAPGNFRTCEWSIFLWSCCLFSRRITLSSSRNKLSSLNRVSRQLRIDERARRARLKLSALNTKSDSPLITPLYHFSLSTYAVATVRRLMNFYTCLFKVVKLYTRERRRPFSYPCWYTAREVRTAVWEMEETSRQKLHSHTRAPGMSYKNVNWLHQSAWVSLHLNWLTFKSRTWNRIRQMRAENWREKSNRLTCQSKNFNFYFTNIVRVLDICHMWGLFTTLQAKRCQFFKSERVLSFLNSLYGVRMTSRI